MNNKLRERLEEGNYSKEILLTHSKSIESICYLTDEITFPSLFQIIGEPFAIIRGMDGKPRGTSEEKMSSRNFLNRKIKVLIY